MVLPGIQATFGFQLIAIFTDHFQRIDRSLQLIHLVSLCLLTIAIALIVTPAAYDRIVRSEYVSERFLRITASVMTVAMSALATGIVLEIYVVASLVTHSVAASLIVALASSALFAVAWFAFPLWERETGK